MRVAEPGRLVEPDRAQEFGDAAVERGSTGQRAAIPTGISVNDKRLGDDILHPKARV